VAEQISRRANNVTSAAFDTPFETHTVRFGVGGLNLKDSLDVMEGWARLTNVWHENEAEATTRPGQEVLATHQGAGGAHSVRVLNDPRLGNATRFWGVGGGLERGYQGATTLIDGGYSGDPLTLLPHRTTLTPDPWMYVADKNKVRKVRGYDGLVLPVGLRKPRTPTTALDKEYSSALVLTLDSTDAAAANWTPAPGRDEEGNLVGTPDAAVDDTTDSGSPAVYLTPNPGDTSGTTGAYDSWWGIALPRNLDVLNEVTGPGTRTASDEDIFHLEMKMAQPDQIAEIRLYIVVSEEFDALQLPGVAPAAPAGGGDAPPYKNTDAYVKAFRPNDYLQFVAAHQSQIEAAEQARIFALRDKDAQTRAYNDQRKSWEDRRAESDPGRAPGFQLGLGSHQWFSYGLLGSPLRRGDFQRIGSTEGRNWSTITGVIIYMRTNIKGVTAIAFGDAFLTGGAGPDTTEPGVQAYDYRCTHYDTRTGAESNGSDVQGEVRTDPQSVTFELAPIDPVRRQVVVRPTAFGDGAMRQKVYRRGGTLIDDWYLVGMNDGDGADFPDNLSDTAIALAGTLPTDHYELVPTVDSDGKTILAQPLAAIFGPLEGMLFGCGDHLRPGFLYFSVPDEPDHWSAFGNVEVCAPSEELMHGGLLGSQGFVFSRQRLYFIYPNLGGAQGVTTAPGLCTRGLISRWAFCVGPGGYIYFVAEDGVFATNGGPEEWLSEAINPLFYGNSINGYLGIDRDPGVPADALRLTVWENALYFQYQDAGGNRQVLVYSLLQKFWRHYNFKYPNATVQGLDERILVVGGYQTGASYLHKGADDAGTLIPCVIQSGSFSAGRREEKLFGDAFLDVDPRVNLAVNFYLNEDTYANNQIPIVASVTGRQRFLLHAFGDSPQKAHSVSCQVSWSSLSPPTLYQLGYSITPQPDLTNARVTNWDDLNSPDEVWLSGLTLDCDTGGADKQIFIERDFAGLRTTVATFTVNSANRHKFKFSWPAVPSHMVRIRPDPVGCAPWVLYRADWINLAEPPRISKWDIHFENRWDQYYTGLDLYCDTGGAEKRIEIWVDQARLINTLGGNLTYWPIVASGRRVVHLTLPWGRGHVFRFFAIDDNPGLLYTHRWHLQEEPSEQANWNQNFSILGTHADKFLKAIIFECDTYGQNKTVQVEVDGAVVETLTVNANGRSVIQRALPTQHLGRVWRMFPVDGNPGRLYSAEPVFDEEPFCFDRWETQETNHGLPGWFYPLYGHITLKASADVTLRTVMQHNQVGGVTTRDYVIPATLNQKQRRFVTFLAGKGVLIKYLLTSAQPFWLYRDETSLVIQPWGAYASIEVRPFGNDDLDPSRPMAHAILAAQSSGGAVAPGQTG
jgi:hypothetical protein